MIIEVVFDVETKQLFREAESSNPADLGVSIVSVYRRLTDAGSMQHEAMTSFWEHELPKMWKLFEDADRIIGFNSFNFDVPALSPYAPQTFAKLRHFDLMDIVKNRIGRRISLSELARNTLKSDKTDVGTNAVQYFRKGDPESLEKLRKYCEADVLLTRDLYDFGFTHKHLKYTDKWNAVREIAVDFSYPKPPPDQSKQFSLF